MSIPASRFSCRQVYDRRYFEQLHRMYSDPWSVLTSRYEHEKFQTTLQALSRPHYRNALELGCSVGGLTRHLSGRCDALTSVDTSSAALQRAHENCNAPQIRFMQADLPDGDWQDSYDLIVLSEILYYFSPTRLAGLAQRLRACIAPRNTELVVVHWTGETDYPLSGDDATGLLRRYLRATVRDSLRAPSYRLETWQVES
jgi:SAM-dependent methyltransferase